MNISFVISDVPGLIDDFITRPPLESTTMEYLTEYILKTSPISKFALTQVELLFQEKLNTTMTSSRTGNNDTSVRSLAPGLRQSRQEQNETVGTLEFVTLQVILNLQGYKIYPIRIVLTDLMLEGVDSPEYTARLRRSNSFYANATASLAAQAMPREVAPTPAPPEDKKGTRVTATVIIVALACMAVFGAVMYRKHARARERSKRELPVCAETPSQYSTGSLRANVFSFDLSPASSTGLGRLWAVFSSDSGGGTSPSSSQESPSSPRKAEVEEHPLTGIIPPMLVIDNIEETGPNASMRVLPEPNDSKRNIVVPTKRMEASASFIEALNNSQAGEQNSSSTLSDMML